ncbi:MAG: DNA adenine methylase [Rhodobacteraceae bacterium]|nr:DNA adenine methylase [Paracoccaceae bacterium]
MADLAEIYASDFEAVIDRAGSGDFIFADPPYTTAHNVNGFVKYNQRIFSWEDQIRLKEAIVRAASRGAKTCLTNADHQSVRCLYDDVASFQRMKRCSVMAGNAQYRRPTSEGLYIVEGWDAQSC